ncbi:SDR family oxidoreductase [Arthrobacter sp. CAL618]|uniref:SDR family oxidoreductase n=1 Tax=Arthrobacter sp. CAL618 TaxID=1055770 RepID=UPI00041FAC67|nr:SDR family oxidoreductase [Arthrobacter sp. CAL618]
MTTELNLTVLVVGATGSIGQHVVAEALRAGHQVRALTRDPGRSHRIDADAKVVVGDLTDSTTLTDAVANIDAVIFTHGSNSAEAEAVNYGAVRNILGALNGRQVRVALMTTIGVTRRRDTSDWKRRGERLVRASGNPYTIVRPGWFDYNEDDQLRITMLQGDTRHAGSPADGVIARHQIARVLVDSLTTPAAVGRTLELVAESGPEQDNLTPLFAALEPDETSSIDGVRDAPNLPQDQEPQHVRDELGRVTPQT